MSPVAADRLTCTTSVEVKIAYGDKVRVYGQTAQRGRGVSKTHLVWENEGKFNFVGCLCIPTTTQGVRTRDTSGGGAGKTECRHRRLGCQ